GLLAGMVPFGCVDAKEPVRAQSGTGDVIGPRFALGVFQLGHGAAGDPFVDVPALGVHADLDLRAVEAAFLLFGHTFSSFGLIFAGKAGKMGIAMPGILSSVGVA